MLIVYNTRPGRQCFADRNKGADTRNGCPLKRLTAPDIHTIIDSRPDAASRQGQPAPLGVLFDSSLDGGIDQILALAMLFGFAAAQQVRVPSVSTSRFNLQERGVPRSRRAIFRGRAGRRFRPQQDSAADRDVFRPASRPTPCRPMVSAAAGESRRRRQARVSARHREVERHGRSGGADAQCADRIGRSERAPSCSPVLPANLLSLLALPDGKDWAAKKARVLSIAGGRFDGGAADPSIRADVAGFRKLLAEWPTRDRDGGRGAERGAAVSGKQPRRHRGVGAESSRSWTRIARSSRCRTTRPSQALAAVLYAVSPEDNYFALSEPGTITILDNGRTRFTPSPGGKHHYLIARPDQKERVLETYVKLVTTQPPPPPRAAGGVAPPPAATPPPQTTAEVRRRAPLLILGAAASLMFGLPARISGQADEFDTAVRPVLTQTCAQCQARRRPAGGMSVTELTSAESLAQHRDVVGSDPAASSRRRHAAGGHRRARRPRR